MGFAACAAPTIESAPLFCGSGVSREADSHRAAGQNRNQRKHLAQRRGRFSQAGSSSVLTRYGLRGLRRSYKKSSFHIVSAQSCERLVFCLASVLKSAMRHRYRLAQVRYGPQRSPRSASALGVSMVSLPSTR